MEERRPSPPTSPARPAGNVPPAQIAKAALTRLAMAKLEPTPENYTRAYMVESGGVEPHGAAGSGSAVADTLPDRALPIVNKLLTLGVSEFQARQDLTGMLRESRWDEALRVLERFQQSSGPAVMADMMAGVMERLMRGLERGGRQWTLARKKDGLFRVLESNRTDPQRLLNRLRQLLISWEGDVADASVEASEAAEAAEEAGGTPSQFFDESEHAIDASAAALPTGSVQYWPDVGASLHQTIQHALPDLDERANALKLELETCMASVREHGASQLRAGTVEELCVRARRMLDHRHHLFGQMGTLCRELSASLVELAEDDSWARGQCEVMTQVLDQPVSSRGVRLVNDMLAGTRDRQRSLREERSRARDSLKVLIQRMLAELSELGEHTDRFSVNVGRYAEVIQNADSLESLAGVVREMVEESHTVQTLVHSTQERLNTEHERASTLSKRVDELEGELAKLSNEVQTDQLTKIANRRGLEAAFNTEQAKLLRDGSVLTLSLLDVDNFKKLNDSLGHAAGDVALKSLAERVTQMLRPGDVVARYGGEEFVLMLPRTPLDEAQQIMTRLQRSLSAALFMHDGKDVFVTFSAGITTYRPGERLEEALDRADEGLYEAKRTGKNRACVIE